MKINLSGGGPLALIGAMMYQIYYPTGCDTSIPDHVCDPCEPVEGARVRSAGLIKKTFNFINPSNPVEWVAAIAAKNVIIIPFTNGTFDGGSEILKDGYGDQLQRLVGYNFKADFKDPNYLHNGAFWNAVKNSTQYKFFYRTETQIHITAVTVQVIPKNPVTLAITDEVVWDIGVIWADQNLPVPYSAPAGIFDNCFDYTGS